MDAKQRETHGNLAPVASRRVDDVKSNSAVPNRSPCSSLRRNGRRSAPSAISMSRHGVTEEVKEQPALINKSLTSKCTRGSVHPPSSHFQRGPLSRGGNEVNDRFGDDDTRDTSSTTKRTSSTRRQSTASSSCRTPQLSQGQASSTVSTNRTPRPSRGRGTDSSVQRGIVGGPVRSSTTLRKPTPIGSHLTDYRAGGGGSTVISRLNKIEGDGGDASNGAIRGNMGGRKCLSAACRGGLNGVGHKTTASCEPNRYGGDGRI
eukprot:GHVN01003441.1.p1 GENE.GHVN01003441.1~~GHVN01003441.1.p1  ORF type:complete len:261 (-),score=41.89 GHVN01003441.1:182-964(-)